MKNTIVPRSLLLFGFVGLLAGMVVGCSDDSSDGECPTGFVRCGEVCIDPLTSSKYCGASGDCLAANAGKTCATGESCDGKGSCMLSCPADMIDCSGACIDPKTNRTYCGASGDCEAANAGTTCTVGEICDGAGSCKLSCQADLVDCGGTCIDPKTDRTHCGASGDCLTANAGKTCSAGEICDGAGSCKLSCQADLIDCGDTCIDPKTNSTYCGASGDCQATNAGKKCAADESCTNSACKVKAYGPDYAVSITKAPKDLYLGAVQNDALAAEIKVTNVGDKLGWTRDWSVYIATDAAGTKMVGKVIQTGTTASLAPAKDADAKIAAALPAGLTAGKYYLVVKMDISDGDPNSGADLVSAAITTVTLKAPDVTAVTDGKSAHKVTWAASAGASKYKVEWARKIKTAPGAWSLAADVSTTTYDHLAAYAKALIYYRVQASRAEGARSAFGKAMSGTKAGTLLFADDFESPPHTLNSAPVSWKSTYNNGGYHRVINRPFTSGKAPTTKQCLGTYNRSTGISERAFAAIQPTYIKYYQATTREVGLVSIGSATGNLITQATYNRYTWLSGDAWQALNTPCQGGCMSVWAMFEYKNINWTAKTYDIYVNGTLAHENVVIGNKATKDVTYIRITHPYTYRAGYFDDVEMWK